MRPIREGSHGVHGLDRGGDPAPPTATPAPWPAASWRPDVGGPSVVAVRPEGVYDVSATSRRCATSARRPTPRPRCALPRASGSARWTTSSPTRRPTARDAGRPWLLAPVDLQALKAAGVTFATSMLERVIEERARGDRGAAERLRGEMAKLIGADLQTLEAGLARRAEAEGGADRARAPGRNISRSASARTRKSSPSRSRCRRSARARRPAFTRPRPGTIRSPRRCSPSPPAARSSARRSATTSTCAISRAAARCCSARRRTRTRAARSARSCACSTRPSASTTCARCRSR